MWTRPLKLKWSLFSKRRPDQDARDTQQQSFGSITSANSVPTTKSHSKSMSDFPSTRSPSNGSFSSTSPTLTISSVSDIESNRDMPIVITSPIINRQILSAPILDQKRHSTPNITLAYRPVIGRARSFSDVPLIEPSFNYKSQISSVFYQLGVCFIVKEVEVVDASRPFTSYEIKVKLLKDNIPGYENAQACIFRVYTRYSAIRKLYLDLVSPLSN